MSLWNRLKHALGCRILGTQTELFEFFNAMDDDQLRTAFKVLRTTGVQPSEKYVRVCTYVIATRWEKANESPATGAKRMCGGLQLQQERA